MTAAPRVVATCAFAVLVLLAGTPSAAVAQDKPSAADVKAVRDCALKKFDQADSESCIFIIATPCTESPTGQKTFGEADCYRREAAAWDVVLNETFQKLRAALDDEQNRKLRAMQRAWIAAREQTCAFYHTVTHGSMAVPMASACVNRETARRTMLLMFFLSVAPGR
jgi:uncharacterized protein YecT (DUF1311 family)